MNIAKLLLYPTLLCHVLGDESEEVPTAKPSLEEVPTAKPSFKDEGHDETEGSNVFNYDDIPELEDYYYRQFGGGLEVEDDEDAIETKVGVEALKLDAVDLEKLEGETASFQAETSRLMDILVNSLYSNEEVFIRELISNGVDAIEKQRVLSLTKDEEDDTELAIYIESIKPEDKSGDYYVIVQDTGVGMSKDELISNLGTVAKSGTKAFQDALSEGGVGNLIGQFGVGFYSSFLVADEVTVVSRAEGHDQYIWTSKADGNFTVYKDPRGNTLKRGTRIELKLKDGMSQYADFPVLKKQIVTQSEFVVYPVFLKRIKDGEESWIHVNPAKPIWQRPRNEVTEAEYHAFYKKLTGDSKPPLAYTHYIGEGEIDFKALLFIPDHDDDTLITGDGLGESDVKLYTRNVLISHERELMPSYLSFVKGIVESDDLPLKVDRESLASSRTLKIIKKKLHKKVLDMMLKIQRDHEKQWRKYKEGKENGEQVEAPKDTYYDRLTDHYSNNLLIGCATEGDIKFKYKLMELPRFSHTGGEGKITLTEYIEPYSSDVDLSNKIWYGWAPTIEALLANPASEQYLKHGRDIILVENAMGDNCLMRLSDYRGVSVENFEKIYDPSIDKESRIIQAERRYFKPFFKAMDQVIKGTYQAFTRSKPTLNLTKSPSVIFLTGEGLTGQQEKHIRSQHWYTADLAWRFRNKELSVNMNHPYVKSLYKIYEEDSESEAFQDGALRLYDFAILAGNHHVERHDIIAKIIGDSMKRFLSIEDVDDYSPPYIPDEIFEEIEQEEQAKKDAAEKKPPVSNPEFDEPEYEADEFDDYEEHDEL